MVTVRTQPDNPGGRDYDPAYTPHVEATWLSEVSVLESHFLGSGGISSGIERVPHRLVQLPKASALDLEKELGHIWGDVVWLQEPMAWDVESLDVTHSESLSWPPPVRGQHLLLDGDGPRGVNRDIDSLPATHQHWPPLLLSLFFKIQHLSCPRALAHAIPLSSHPRMLAPLIFQTWAQNPPIQGHPP